MEQVTCCFTGHRILSREDIQRIRPRLAQAVDAMIRRGVTTFISGGALGFDQMAALEVLSRRDEGHAPIRLIIAQPCRSQAARWTAEQRRNYEQILARADEVVCLAETYYNGCMQARNRWMVEHAAYVIACMARLKGGTAQTVSYALKKDRQVLNLWE